MSFFLFVIFFVGSMGWAAYATHKESQTRLADLDRRLNGTPEEQAERLLIEQRKEDLAKWDATFEKETGKSPFPPKRKYIDRSVLNKKPKKKDELKARLKHMENQIEQMERNQTPKYHHGVRKLWM